MERPRRPLPGMSPRAAERKQGNVQALLAAAPDAMVPPRRIVNPKGRDLLRADTVDPDRVSREAEVACEADHGANPGVDEGAGYPPGLDDRTTRSRDFPLVTTPADQRGDSTALLPGTWTTFAIGKPSRCARRDPA